MSLLFIFMVISVIFAVISVISMVIPVISVNTVNRHTGFSTVVLAMGY